MCDLVGDAAPPDLDGGERDARLCELLLRRRPESAGCIEVATTPTTSSCTRLSGGLLLEPYRPPRSAAAAAATPEEALRTLRGLSLWGAAAEGGPDDSEGEEENLAADHGFWPTLGDDGVALPEPMYRAHAKLSAEARGAALLSMAPGGGVQQPAGLSMAAATQGGLPPQIEPACRLRVRA